MNLRKSIFLVASTLLLLVSCKNEAPQQAAAVQEEASLKTAFKDDFYIGAAINADLVDDEIRTALEAHQK